VSPHGGTHLILDRKTSIRAVDVEGPLKEVERDVPVPERGQQQSVPVILTREDRQTNPVLSQHLAYRLLELDPSRLVMLDELERLIAKTTRRVHTYLWFIGD